MSNKLSDNGISEIREIYSHLCQYVQDDWHDIPSGEMWKSHFKCKYSGLLDKFRPSNITQEIEMDNTDVIDKIDDKIIKDNLNDLAITISRGLEGTWLEMRNRIVAIRNESQSKPLNLDELVKYAINLGGTTCAPPETNNITDEMFHNHIFPKYHFLGRVGIKDIHSSRFFYLQKLSTITFPPIIHFLDGENENLKKLKITCRTKGCRIFFRVNDNEKVREYTGEMPFKNIPFKITAWAEAPGLAQSQIIQSHYMPNAQSDISLHSELFLGKGKK